MIGQSILDFLNTQQPDMQPMNGMNTMQPQAPTMPENDMVKQILSSRFQPTAQDVGNSALAGISNNSYVNPQQLADQRMKMAMDQLQTMASLQSMPLKNQLIQSEITKNNAMSGMGMMGSGAGITAANQPNGDAFLATLPAPIASQVKAIAEGKMPFPSGMALKTPYWQQMLQAVSAYDPNFDAINYNARAKTRQSFVAGQDANNITALNTAMAHAASLKDAYDNLGNTDYPAYNATANWVGNTFGSKNIQTNTADVQTKGHALSEELAKVFRSTGMAESDVRAWEQKLTDSASPAQSSATINGAMDLIDGRLQALASKYNQGMGTAKNGIELLSPEAQAAYQKIRGGAQQSIQSPSASPSTEVNWGDLK